MPSNIRVHELARELGLTNKETLDLCVALGIGVKTHSSSVVEAQADRVRRKAEREGLIREVQPEEPEAEKKPAKKAAAKKTAAKKAAAADAAETPTETPEPVVVDVPAAPEVTDVATDAAAVAAADTATAEVGTGDAAGAAGATAAPAAPKRVISSSGSA
ncbi:MAG: translation initiation factor IF-2, partial [Actinobacteria bacterium]|nr:translation initiation factor IF-2 [Actinomycetota bacterium]